MELPFFFGNNGELFGLYHPADSPAVKAVLLCPPLGQDHVRCHRLYRQLANALVTEGFAVLRFDYYGSGDSAGASTELDWNRCVENTIAAADELRARSGADRIVAFGARLGGSIAQAAAAAARFAEVILWDPILDGRAHVAQLDTLQAELRKDPQRFVKPRPEAEAPAQWLGFAVSPGLRQQLIEFQPTSTTAPTLVLDSQPSAATREWGRLDGGAAEVIKLQPFTPWDDLGRLELAILSHPLIQMITGHLRGTP